MKILKATILNIDKPDKNGNCFSKQALDDAMTTFCDKPLYLLKEIPELNISNSIKEEDIIGVALESRWSDDDTKLTHTFKLYEDKIKDIDFSKVYPAMYGRGELVADNHVTTFTLYGFGLCKEPSFDTEVRIFDGGVV